MSKIDFLFGEFLARGKIEVTDPDTGATIKIEPKAKFDTLRFQETALASSSNVLFSLDLPESLDFIAYEVHGWSVLPIKVAWRPDGKSGEERNFVLYQPRDIDISPAALMGVNSVILVTNENIANSNFYFEIKGFYLPQDQTPYLTALARIMMRQPITLLTIGAVNTQMLKSISLMQKVLCEVNKAVLPPSILDECKITSESSEELVGIVAPSVPVVEKVPCKLPKYLED